MNKRLAAVMTAFLILMATAWFPVGLAYPGDLEADTITERDGGEAYPDGAFDDNEDSLAGVGALGFTRKKAVKKP